MIDTLEGIQIRWMDFETYAPQIYALRQAVFVEGQGLETLLSSPKDATGIHLGAFHGDTLVAGLSAYLYTQEEPIFEQWKLPPTNHFAVQFSRRATLSTYQATRISELLACMMWKSVYETIKPSFFIMGLIGVHKRLATYYVSSFGFEHYCEAETPNFGIASVYVGWVEKLKSTYIRTRGIAEAICQAYHLIEPPLALFLQQNPRLSHLCKDYDNENLYLKPLSFKDELPRLSAQARLVYSTQVPIIEQINFPTAPAKFLDVGCGPGVYLSLLSKNSKFEGYEFAGMDYAAEMITYAKISYGKIKWKQGSIYETKYEDNTFDVIHVSFVLIHLTNPALALAELYRILKPNGVLYVVDVNDDTFQGPPIIRRMIHKHKQIYEGHRDIMNFLPTLAKEINFQLENQFHVVADNTGSEGEVIHEPQKLRLGRINLWAMFAFIAQREEVKDYYQNAEAYYLSSICEISIQIQSHVYRKVVQQ